ncbi:MAG: hypothetical protein V1799_17790 [bacterium]
MLGNYLNAIEGIATYPLVTLMIFFSFFIAVLVMVVRMKKEHIDKMRQLPLE